MSLTDKYVNLEILRKFDLDAAKSGAKILRKYIVPDGENYVFINDVQNLTYVAGPDTYDQIIVKNPEGVFETFFTSSLYMAPLGFMAGNPYTPIYKGDEVYWKDTDRNYIVCDIEDTTFELTDKFEHYYVHVHVSRLSLPKKYVNIYKSQFHDTLEDAEKKRGDRCIMTIQIEYDDTTQYKVSPEKVY